MKIRSKRYGHRPPSPTIDQIEQDMLLSHLPKILRHDMLNDEYKEMQLYAIAHVKGEHGEGGRYCVFVHAKTWPILVWTQDNDTWYYNAESRVAIFLTDHLPGTPQPMTAQSLKSVAKVGMTQAVMNKMKEAST